MSDELSKLDRVEELFTKAAEAAGGRVVYFGLQPSKREVTVMVDVDEDLFLDEVGKQFKDEFEEIQKNFTVQRKDDKIVEAVADLADLEQKLRDPKEGIP